MSEAKNLVFGGAECPTFNDQFFCNVRSFYGIADDFANDSFTFDNLKSGGGKGGDPMVRTTDLLFFVKQLNPGDHQVLVDPAFAQAFSAHITNAELPSVIGPIVAHFSNPNTRKNYMVMLNVLSYDGQYHKQYDLKGCADDRLLVNDGERIVVVRKRIWSLHVRCGCGGPLRKIYKDGKLEALHQPFLPISEADKKLLLEALERDVKFLQENELMDYSLIVGVVKRDAASADGNLNKDTLTADSELYAGKPLVSFHHEQETVLFLGIIDFLQKWTAGKTIANAIKVFERNKATIRPKFYGDRFLVHFDHVLIAMDSDHEEQHKRRDGRVHPHRCYPLSKR